MYEIYLTNGETREKLHEMDPNSDRRASLCEFTSGVNIIPSAEIALFPFNPCYEKINPMTSTIEIVNTKTGNTDFEGRVLKIPTNGMDSSGVIAKRFTCEGFMGYLYDSVQIYRKIEQTTPSQLLYDILDYHNTNVPEEKKIYLGACDISGNIYDQYIDYAQTMSEIKRLLLEPFGGELWLRRNSENKLVLDWLKTPDSPIVSDTTIELSKNMKSMNIDSDSTHIITRLIPLGAKLTDAQTGDQLDERLTIASEPDGYIDQEQTLYKHGICIDDVNAMAQYGVICGTVIFDDIDSAHPLVGMASTYIRNNNRIRKSYKAEVLDLSTINLEPEELVVGMAYRFTNRMIPLDDTLRLTKKTVDIFNAHSPTVEIGDKAEKLTDIATRAVNFIEYKMPKVKTDILDSAKATASALIKSGFNGYVVANENEICIMDTPDKETATKVWRFNLSGLGYSNTGYDGTYGLAMTMDGAIVADFITTGILRSLQIINGNNGEFSVDTAGNCIANSFQSNNAIITGGRITVSSSTGSIVIGSGTITFNNLQGNAVLILYPDGTFRMWNDDVGNWVQDSFWGLETGLIRADDRISVLQNKVTDHETRISRLEGN